jgi:hypothetical protein
MTRKGNKIHGMGGNEKERHGMSWHGKARKDKEI